MVLAASIYRKIVVQENLPIAWQTMKQSFEKRWDLLTLMVAFMIINWTLEACKWRILVSPVQKVSLTTSCKAVLSGLSISLFIPNGVGEWFGRSAFLNEGNRLRSVAIGFVGSLAQLFITLVMGLCGLFFLIQHNVAITDSSELSLFWFKSLMYAVLLGVIFICMVYFNIGWITKVFEKIPIVHRYRLFVDALTTYSYKVLLRILFLSLARYGVFIIQYVLIFSMLGIDISVLYIISGTCTMFLLMAIVPTIPVAELGVRGEVSLRIFGLITSNHLGILSATTLIWLINLIIPATIGSLFVLSLKLFKSKTIHKPLNK